MQSVVLLVHLFLAISLVVVVLLQRSEGGALGIGGGGGMGGFMTARGQTNLLTRATAVIAALFILTSLTLAILSDVRERPRSIVDQPVAPAGQVPETPSVPSVPLSR